MNALEELYMHIRVGGNQDCQHLRTLGYQVELYSVDYKDIYADYKESIKKIEQIYGKNKYLSPAEHIQKMQAYMNILPDIGTFRLHARYPYPEERPPDDFEFNVNELVDDVTNIDEEFVTQMILERESNIMYLIPERTEENVNLFFKALTDYIQMNKGVHYEK